MDLTHSDLVAWSLARVKALGDTPARLFLARLAELDPSLLTLFGATGANDRLARTRVHLLAASGFHEDRARAALRTITQRCRQRPVGLRDQAVLLSAALWTLKHMLGAGFTHADREAWVAYQQQMVRALEGAALTHRGRTP